MSKSSGARKDLAFVDPARFTPQFAWRGAGADRGVFCEDVSLAKIARQFGTPTYVYSKRAMENAYDELKSGLRRVPHLLCFAVKANGNLSILKLLAQRGSGFDIVSGGELDHLRRIGVRGDRIVFSGVGKTREEIREALLYRAGQGSSATGILQFNVESRAELDVLLGEASRPVVKRTGIPGISVRVNPDVKAGGHPHISTGMQQHKFGMGWAEAKTIYAELKNSKYVRTQGISAHIGSQIVELGPFREALQRLAGYVGELRKECIALKFLDFGGGLGVRYTQEAPVSRRSYARMVAEVARPLGLQLLLEPGRSIVAQAGVLLTRVVYTKSNSAKTFVIADAAMNDLIRPVLYDAPHPITKVVGPASGGRSEDSRVDVVGPVCETGDCFLENWPFGKVDSGDLLAIWAAGAYGMVQASNYNGRGRPAEVLVSGNKARLIRRRETREDLLRTDVLF